MGFCGSGPHLWDSELEKEVKENPAKYFGDQSAFSQIVLKDSKKSNEVFSCLSLAGLGAGSSQFRTHEMDFVLCLWREEMVACARVPAPPLSSWVPPPSAPAFLLCLRAIA